MATIRLPPDFKEFLKLLNSKQVEYLLIGGFAVSYYGYPRPTGDMDVWIARNQAHAERVTEARRDFGFGTAGVSVDLFLKEEQIVRMGVPPIRIEVLTSISGVDFADC